MKASVNQVWLVGIPLVLAHGVNETSSSMMMSLFRFNLWPIYGQYEQHIDLGEHTLIPLVPVGHII